MSDNCKSGKELQQFQVALRGFLKTSAKKQFLAEEIKEIGQIDFEFEYYKEKFPVRTYSNCLIRLDQFEISTDKRAFPFIPVSSGDWIFLEWKNSEIPDARDRKQIVSELRKLKKGEMPPFFYVEITRETFEEEAGSTQTPGSLAVTTSLVTNE